MPETANTRYEIKLVSNEVHLPTVRSWLQLHPSGFFVGYPPRQINNLYFDTPQLDSYSENLAGISMRRKLRLRWYGETPINVKGILELKCKRSFQGWKVSQKLPEPLSLSPELTWHQLRQTLRPILKPELKYFLDRYSWPVLLNQYQREYYLSFDRQVRITLDFQLRAYDQRLSTTPNLTRNILPSGKMVVEVKANREHRALLSETLAQLPLRVGKHSKYALAMEAVLG